MAITIAFETTTVSAEKTAIEIEDMLRKHGCEKIAKSFESGRIKEIYFQVSTLDATMPFKLPVNVEPVYQILYEKRKQGSRFPYYQNEIAQLQQKIHDQAERTAWRIIHGWLRSQLALLQTQMVTVTEIFLPYMLVAENETLYQRLMDGGLTALMPSPNG